MVNKHNNNEFIIYWELVPVRTNLSRAFENMFDGNKTIKKLKCTRQWPMLKYYI